MSSNATSTQSEKRGNGSDTSAFGTDSNKSGGKDMAVQHTEGAVAKTIEEQTAKLPSDLFLWAAVGAMGVSAVFEFTGNSDKSRFIGQWVAPLLLFGVYNKLVKVAGSDQLSK